MYLLSSPDLFNMIKHINNISNSSWGLFNFTSQTNARHGRNVKGNPDKTFGIIKSLKEYASRCHCNLKYENKEFEINRNDES